MTKIAIPLLAALTFWLAVPATSLAAVAYTTENLYLRAGPDARYPSVVILRKGERVELLGCINGLQWCEVETEDDERGWTAAHYLRTTRGSRNVTIIESHDYGGVRIFTYSPYDYWDRYYRTKYFYRDRDKWLGHYPSHSDGRNNDHDHHGGGSHQERPQKPRTVKKVEEPKYQWENIVKNPTYNPLCPKGERSC